MPCLSLKRKGRMRKERKHCAAEQKVIVLRIHLHYNTVRLHMLSAM